MVFSRERAEKERKNGLTKTRSKTEKSEKYNGKDEGERERVN